MNLTPGTLIGSYEIKRRLGTGGMGEVYFARDTRLGRYVALKLLLPELTANADRLRRFKQEARTTSALNHPNIVTIFEIGEADSLHYLVTEFIDGLTLRHFLTDGTISVEQILDIAIQSASALAAAQALGIVHRDIKPENIMRRADGYVKVLDFGLAKLMPTAESMPSDENLSTAIDVRTDPGSIVGTVAYMSPEQLRGTHVDGRSDIWSLGVVIYEMVARRPPFAGVSKSDIIAAILREEPPLLTNYSPEVPAELQQIVSRMLRKEPAERYQSPQDLIDDLRELKHELDLSARRQPTDRPAARTSERTAASISTEAATERVDTSKIPAARPTSGVELLISEIKRHRAGATVIGLSIVLAVAVAAPTISTVPGKSLPVIWFSVLFV